MLFYIASTNFFFSLHQSTGQRTSGRYGLLSVVATMSLVAPLTVAVHLPDHVSTEQSAVCVPLYLQLLGAGVGRMSLLN